MNILITGGLGHIGSYIISSINKIKKLDNIYIIDNNSNNSINSNFNYNKKKIKLIIDDLCDKNSFKSVKHKINIILHLASITDAESSLKNRKKVYDTLIKNYREGIKNLMKEPERHREFAIDKNWLQLQKRDRWFFIIPATVIQFADYSDIEERYTDYNHLMLEHHHFL